MTKSRDIKDAIIGIATNKEEPNKIKKRTCRIIIILLLCLATK